MEGHDGSFSPEILACPCCGELEFNPLLYDGLKELNWWVMRPVVITSGYRCSDHNVAIDGHPNSYHVKGMAADLYIPELSFGAALELVLAVDQFREGGIGLDPGNKAFHLDVRYKQARWGKVNGHFVGFDRVLGIRAA